MLAGATWILLGGSSVLAGTYFYVTTFMRKRRHGEPQVVKGSWLWGSAIDFNQHAVNFLLKAEKTYGKVFTMRLVNQHITIIMDPHSYEAMHKEKNFDFDPIQKQVNWNVFNFVLKEPRKMIKDTGKTVRGINLPKVMKHFSEKLDYSYQKVSQNPKAFQTGGLRQFCAETVFDALFNTIFGNSDAHAFNSKNTFKNFELFHKYFNFFWLGMPKICFPKAVKALKDMLQQPSAEELLMRDDSSEYIKTAVEYMKTQGQTAADIMGHNLVYLHVNYNTFRVAFWAIDLLLEHPEAFDALMKELQEAIHYQLDDTTNTATFTVKDLESLPILDSVCQESLRISSGVFMIRYVQEDTQFTTSDGTTHLIRGGDRIAMYPPATHKDPEIFENPLEFQYDRFVNRTYFKEGKELKNPVMAFGTLCPGQRCARAQLKWYLLTVLARFDMQLLPGEHAEFDDQYHGHEILPPKADVNFRYKVRQNCPTLQLV